MEWDGLMPRSAMACIDAEECDGVNCDDAEEWGAVICIDAESCNAVN